jgi:B12-binding domain/radical SAM domain protein
MKRKVRFTFVFDRASRTATAALIASVEVAAGDDYSGAIRAVPYERLGHVDFDPGLAEFVLMSAMTQNFPARAEALASLKTRCGGAFTGIIGGPHATGDPRGALEAGFDYCCRGEGEGVVRDVYDYAASGHSLDEISGLFRLLEGEVAGEPRCCTVDIDGFDPLPRRVRFPTYIEVGRGCRWGCAYCQTPRIFGRAERFRSPRRVEDIASHYVARGMRDVRLLLPNALAYGSTQPAGPDCAALDEVLGRVRASCPGARIYLGSFPSEVRPDYVTPESIGVLKKHVSNDSLVIGGQSGSDRVLEWVGRGHTVEDIRRAAREVKAGGFGASVDLMLGFPVEEPGDREATFDLAEELGRDDICVNMHFLMPLPGTPLSGPTGYSKRTLETTGREFESMARPRQAKPKRVKIFCGLIGRDESIRDVLEHLIGEFGEVDCETDVREFDSTEYYAEEMGCGLKRKWIGFAPLRERGYLARAKHLCVELELKLASDGNRTINIDPGYVDDAQVVLATTKNFAHRLYIGMGYYAEPTLIYVKGERGYRPLEWTYPDYKTVRALRFFRDARCEYLRQVKQNNEA